MEVSSGTIQFYKIKLNRFIGYLLERKGFTTPSTLETENEVVIALKSCNRQEIEQFLVQFKNPGNRHAYFRAIKTFYNWLEQNFNFPNPMKNMKAPRLPKLIMPSLDKEQVLWLIARASNSRDKAIISLFTESGLRLSELGGIYQSDINWNDHTIKVMGKGQKEALAPFGQLTGKYLKEWLSEYQPDGGNIWGLNIWGIESMLRRLKKETGLPCNPHTFRRTFACLLRKSGLDSLTIKDLGRWETLDMVQRYTRSITFQDSMKQYKNLFG